MSRNEEVQTEQLYGLFTSILDKLRPHNIDTLLRKVKTLNINTQQRLEGVVDLIFEKALEVPDPKVYAVLSNKLSMLKVPADNATSEGQCVNFWALIISKCQWQFVQHHSNTDKKEIDTEGDKAETSLGKVDTEGDKAETHLGKVETDVQPAVGPDSNELAHTQTLDEDENQLKSALGNIRFIAELYKIKMLTAKIMVYCMNCLLSRGNTSSLQCLCEFLSVPGFGEQLISEVKEPMDNVFHKMQEIVDRKMKSDIVSERVRTLMQDVIELRKMKWIPEMELQHQRSLARTLTPDGVSRDTQHQHFNKERQPHKATTIKMPKKKQALSNDDNTNNKPPPMYYNKWRKYREPAFDGENDRNRNNSPAIVDKRKYNAPTTTTLLGENIYNPPTTFQGKKRKYPPIKFFGEKINNPSTKSLGENINNLPVMHCENREDDFMRLAMTAILGEADKFLKLATLMPLPRDSKVYNCLNELRRLALQHSGLAKETVDVGVQVENVVTHEECTETEQVSTKSVVTSFGDLNETEQVTTKSPTSFGDLNETKQVTTKSPTSFEDLNETEQVTTKSPTSFGDLNETDQVTTKSPTSFGDLNEIEQVTTKSPTSFEDLNETEHVTTKSPTPFGDLNETKQVTTKSPTSFEDLNETEQVTNKSPTSFGDLNEIEQVTTKSSTSFGDLNEIEQVTTKSPTSFGDLNETEQVTTKSPTSFRDLNETDQVTTKSPTSFGDLNETDQVTTKSPTSLGDLNEIEQVTTKSIMSFGDLNETVQSLQVTNVSQSQMVYNDEMFEACSFLRPNYNLQNKCMSSPFNLALQQDTTVYIKDNVDAETLKTNLISYPDLKDDVYFVKTTISDTLDPTVRIETKTNKEISKNVIQAVATKTEGDYEFNLDMKTLIESIMKRGDTKKQENVDTMLSDDEENVLENSNSTQDNK